MMVVGGIWGGGGVEIEKKNKNSIMGKIKYENM